MNEKPKRNRLNWQDTSYANCVCGKWARLAEGLCPDCHDADYWAEVEGWYQSQLFALTEERDAILVKNGDLAFALADAIEERDRYRKEASRLREALSDLVEFVQWHKKKGRLPLHINTPNTGALDAAIAALSPSPPKSPDILSRTIAALHRCRDEHRDKEAYRVARELEAYVAGGGK